MLSAHEHCSSQQLQADCRHVQPGPGHHLQANQWYGRSQMTSLLEGCGFHVLAVKLFPRPTPLPEGIRGWLQTFANPFLRDLPSEPERMAVLDEVVAAWEAEHALTGAKGAGAGPKQSSLDYVR